MRKKTVPNPPHSLQAELRNGDKSLVGNKGYRRYLKVEGSGHFVIDEKQVKAEERYDGIWVLRTNTVYNAETVAHVYKRCGRSRTLFVRANRSLRLVPSTTSAMRLFEAAAQVPGAQVTGQWLPLPYLMPINPIRRTSTISLFLNTFFPSLNPPVTRI
jgi:hypothetical protein